MTVFGVLFLRLMDDFSLIFATVVSPSEGCCAEDC